MSGTEKRFSQEGFRRIQCHTQEDKQVTRDVGPAVHWALREPRPKEGACLQKKARSETPFSWFLKSRNQKRCRQRGSRQSTPLSTIRTRYGNSVSTLGATRTAKNQQNLSKREADTEFQYRPHIVDTGHRLGTPFLRTPFPRLLWRRCLLPMHAILGGRAFQSTQKMQCSLFAWNTLWQNYCLQELIWSIFTKIASFTCNSLKMSFFLGESEGTKCVKNYENNSQGMLFVIMSRQRLPLPPTSMEQRLEFASNRCWGWEQLQGTSSWLTACFIHSVATKSGWQERDIASSDKCHDKSRQHKMYFGAQNYYVWVFMWNIDCIWNYTCPTLGGWGESTESKVWQPEATGAPRIKYLTPN